MLDQVYGVLFRKAKFFCERWPRGWSKMDGGKNSERERYSHISGQNKWQDQILSWDSFRSVYSKYTLELSSHTHWAGNSRQYSNINQWDNYLIINVAIFTDKNLMSYIIGNCPRITEWIMMFIQFILAINMALVCCKSCLTYLSRGLMFTHTINCIQQRCQT